MNIFYIVLIIVLIIIVILLIAFGPLLWSLIRTRYYMSKIKVWDESDMKKMFPNLDEKTLKRIDKLMEESIILNKGSSVSSFKEEAIVKDGYTYFSYYYQYSDEGPDDDEDISKHVEYQNNIDTSKYDDLNFYNNTVCSVSKEQFHPCLFTLKERTSHYVSEYESEYESQLQDYKEIILDNNPEFTRDFIIKSSDEEEKVKKFFNEKVCKLFKEFHQSGYQYETYDDFLIIYCPRRLDGNERSDFVSKTIKLMQDIIFYRVE